MEASWLLYAAYILGGYLLGSILFGSILPKTIKGIDITVCSRDGNPGTANAMQYAGIGVGLLCLLGDLAKGFLPVFLGVRRFGIHPPVFRSGAGGTGGRACFFAVSRISGRKGHRRFFRRAAGVAAAAGDRLDTGRAVYLFFAGFAHPPA